MNLIVFLIVVFFVVKSVSKSNEAQKKQGSQPNRPAGYGQSQQRPLAKPVQQRPVPNQMPRQSTPYQTPRPAQPVKSKPSSNSILEKAKQHTAQQFSDDTKSQTAPSKLGSIQTGDAVMVDKAKARHIHSEHEEIGHETDLHNQLGVDDFDTYHLLDEVNDLIVKGYSGNLEFERDFIAEGVDMLNRSLEMGVEV